MQVLRPEQNGKLSAREHGEILAKENDSDIVMCGYKNVSSNNVEEVYINE